MPILDYRFPVLGTTIPADHGYKLYSALADLLPEIHLTNRSSEDGIVPWSVVAIHPISGSLRGGRQMRVDRDSQLTIRAPHELAPRMLALAGHVLRVGVSSVRLGIPCPSAIEPHPNLKSRLVVIKGYQDPDGFLAAASTQLAAAGIDGTLHLSRRQSNHSVDGGTGAREGLELRRTI